MDLMSVTTSYSELEKKYSNFNAPSLEITVGSTKLVSGKDIRIVSMDVELTCDYEASGCVFVLESVYEPKKTNFVSEISCLQIGEKVEVEVGYVRREAVFKGYVNRINYRFGMEEDGVSICVECMDVKGLLMKNRRLEIFTEKSASAVVSKILGEAPASSYLSGKEIDSCNEDEVPLRSNMVTDYDLIVEQASKLGFEFFILLGKAYFRAKQKVSSILLEISPQDAILGASLSVSGQSLVKKVEIRSIDETSGEQIRGEASISGTFSRGSSGNMFLGNSRQVYYEPGVKDANEAKARASARIEAAADSFGELECECIGIPELCPGRFVKVSGLSSEMNGKYYVHYVRHMLDESGYRTFVKARVNSL